MKIYYQGIKGCYSSEAILKFFPFTNTVSCNSFSEVFENVNNDYGFIPIENVTGGRIEENFKHLINYDFQIIGEYNFLVKHALMGYGNELFPIIGNLNVYSHPQALKQCALYISKNKLISTEFNDTAGSAEYISKNKIKDVYCIASEFCSSLYNLTVIDRNIQDVKNNITKFILISKTSKLINRDIYYLKTSVILDSLNPEILKQNIYRIDTYQGKFYVDYYGDQVIEDKIKSLGSYAVYNDLKIGIIGFGRFGQFLYHKFKKYASIFVHSRKDYSDICPSFINNLESFLQLNLDIIVFSNSIVSFKDVLSNIDNNYLRDKLLVDVLSVKKYPKNLLLGISNTDILCTHPMFGPDSASESWEGQKFIYEKVRITNHVLVNKFLKIFQNEGCKMIEMSCEEHDKNTAESQFITHLTGRILDQVDLKENPISTNGFDLLLGIKNNTCKDSFDLFKGLFEYNTNSEQQLEKFRESLDNIENSLYNSDRNRQLLKIKQSPTVKFDSEVSKMEGVTKFNVGSTDYPIHDNIKASVINAVKNNKNTYTHVAGTIELRTKISKYLLEKKGTHYLPDQIICSNGAKQSIYQVLLLLCNPGDSVAIFRPYWTSYPDMVKLVRGKVIIVDSIEELKKIKAKIIIICNPNNPTGNIYSVDKLKEISNAATNMNAFIISDEIYERIDYEKKHHSIVKFYDYHKTFTINGFSKIYSMMGYRLGYAAVPPKYAPYLVKIQSQITSCPCILSQEAAIAALNLTDNDISTYVSELKQKRDYMCNIFKTPKPDGGIYLFVKGINHLELLNQHKLAVMPGSAFGMDGYVRICYSTSWGNLEKFNQIF
jgi:exosome complex component RRP43